MDYMGLALEQAKAAYDVGEVPVGAVIIKNMEVVSVGHNLTEATNDPTAHAEIVAIRRACEALGTQRLTGCDMYVTLEPCAMCTGAIINARIRDLYIGAPDKKAGCCGSVKDLVTKQYFNHKVNVFYGIKEEACSKILTDFFKEMRKCDQNELTFMKI